MTVGGSELDAMIRAAAQPYVEEGETVVAWVVLAGTRNFRDGGTVVILPSESGTPVWLAKGLLTEALDEMRNGESRVVDYDDGDDPDLGEHGAA